MRRFTNAKIPRKARCQEDSGTEVMEGCDFNENMTVDDFGRWLNEKGFSTEIRKHFEGRLSLIRRVAYVCFFYAMILDEEMDGEAIFDAIGLQVGPDCLKDVLPKYGLSYGNSFTRGTKISENCSKIIEFIGAGLRKCKCRRGRLYLYIYDCKHCLQDLSTVTVSSPTSSVSTYPVSSVISLKSSVFNFNYV